MPSNAQKVIDACNLHWAANQGDCNKFAKAVAQELRVTIPPGADADGIIDFLSRDAAWTQLTLGSGTAAKAAADAGKFVLGGMRSTEHNPVRPHGHVLVVLSGPLDPAHQKYARASWGSLGGGAKQDSFVNFSFNSADRDRVRYFSRDLP